MRFRAARTLIVAGMVSVIALAIVYAGLTYTGGTADDAYRKSTTKQRYWEEVIARLGPAEAYAEFKDMMNSYTQSQKHVHAHYFGGALYAQLGLINVFSICGEEFSFGCHHQFIGNVLADHGIEGVLALRQKCIDTMVSDNACVHSIGHGLLAFAGAYDLSAVQGALKQCDTVPNTDERHPVPECYRGVFMEQNFQIMSGKESTRPVTEDGLFFPCDALTGEKQTTCYYVQAQWWHGLYGNSKEESVQNSAFKKMGALCAQLDSAVTRESCFAGIGTAIAWDLSYDPKTRAGLCEIATTNPTFRFRCKTHLAFWLRNILLTEPEAKRYDPALVCDGMEGRLLKACELFASGYAIRYPADTTQ